MPATLLPETRPPPMIPPGALAALPLRGLTLLAVEDSRLTCDALRLMCQRSGARLRRAESLQVARAHLRVYRPDVVLVDLGLPDGRGEALIRDLRQAGGAGPVILALSGDPDLRAGAMAAGAMGFLDKPLPGLAAFQAAILRHLAPPPGALQPGRGGQDRPVDPDALTDRVGLGDAADEAWGAAAAPNAALADPRPDPDPAQGAADTGARGPCWTMATDTLQPPHSATADPQALADDLARAAALAARNPGLAARRYLAGFVAGIARSTGDTALAATARASAADAGALPDLVAALQARLAACERGFPARTRWG